MSKRPDSYSTLQLVDRRSLKPLPPDVPYRVSNPNWRHNRSQSGYELKPIDASIIKFSQQLMKNAEVLGPAGRFMAVAGIALLAVSCASASGAVTLTPEIPHTPTPDLPILTPTHAFTLTPAFEASVTAIPGSGGGRPPLCDPLLAPFVPGEKASQRSDGVWVDSQGNPLKGADVDGSLLAMSELAEDEFRLHVQTAGLDEGFRWWIQSLDRNGRPGWNGSSQDSFLDRPDSLPKGTELKINLLPDPGIAGEIKFGISGGEVTAAVIAGGQVVKCFDPVTNEWFIPDSVPATTVPKSTFTSIPESALTPIVKPTEKSPTPTLTATATPTITSTPRPTAIPATRTPKPSPTFTLVPSPMATPGFPCDNAFPDGSCSTVVCVVKEDPDYRLSGTGWEFGIDTSQADVITTLLARGSIILGNCP